MFRDYCPAYYSIPESSTGVVHKTKYYVLLLCFRNHNSPQEETGLGILKDSGGSTLLLRFCTLVVTLDFGLHHQLELSEKLPVNNE